MKNGSQMNQTKLLSSNPDRLDLLMESEQVFRGSIACRAVTEINDS
jgi:hypothetical protein